MSSTISNVYFIPIAYRKLGGICQARLRILFLPCFPVKKAFSSKKSVIFLSLHYPLPVFGLRGIKPWALASCYFSLNSNLPFCLLHLFSLWSSVLNYTNLSNLPYFTPINGKDGSVQLFPCVMVVTPELTSYTHPCPGWDSCPHHMLTFWMRVLPVWPLIILDKSRCWWFYSTLLPCQVTIHNFRLHCVDFASSQRYILRLLSL